MSWLAQPLPACQEAHSCFTQCGFWHVLPTCVQLWRYMCRVFITFRVHRIYSLVATLSNHFLKPLGSYRYAGPHICDPWTLNQVISDSDVQCDCPSFDHHNFVISSYFGYPLSVTSTFQISFTLVSSQIFMFLLHVCTNTLGLSSSTLSPCILSSVPLLSVLSDA